MVPRGGINRSALGTDTRIFRSLLHSLLSNWFKSAFLLFNFQKTWLQRGPKPLNALILRIQFWKLQLPSTRPFQGSAFSQFFSLAWTIFVGSTIIAVCLNCLRQLESAIRHGHKFSHGLGPKQKVDNGPQRSGSVLTVRWTSNSKRQSVTWLIYNHHFFSVDFIFEIDLTL